jgi:tetratricopeptide (TPR) repeat protein
MNERRPLSSFVVEPEVRRSRTDRQWQAISRSAERRPFLSVPQVALLLVAAGALLFSLKPNLEIALDDGSQIELSPDAKLEMLENRPESMRVELRSGRARFDIEHIDRRQFSVLANGIEVRVIGTRFTVTHSEEVHVEVERGIVEVHGAGPIERVFAGQSWRGAKTLVPPPAQVEPKAEVQQPIEPPKARAKRHHKRIVTLANADAKELFELARAARRSGRIHDAADAYVALLDRFPGDRRASLAAFDLGRLRMDSLSDPASAIEALERALELAPNAAFREDALARLVHAHEQNSDRSACERAREDYLREYPEGVHAQVLGARCKR